MTEPVPTWEQRFRAARVSLPDAARDAPDRCVYTGNATGTFELYTWDRATGTTVRATARPNGTSDGELTPDGEQLWWFDDTDGDEFGVWRVQPFGLDGADAGAGTGAATGAATGRAIAPEPAVPGLAPGYPAGLELGRSLSVVGRDTDDGSEVVVVRPTGTSVLHRSAHSASAAGLSRAEDLVLLEHAEHGDSRHPALRVLRPDGELVADFWDGEGLGLQAVGFSPVAGDPRVLALHEQRGRPEPLVWDPVGGTVDRPGLDIEGDLSAQWYPDGTALLVLAESGGRGALHRVELAGGSRRLETPAGTIGDATVRPDGTVEFSWSSAAEPPQIRSTSGALVLAAPGPRPPGSVPVTDAYVDGPGGTVHALVARPPGDGPLPTVFLVHGGPTWHDSDAFAADRAAYVDLGCAVVQVNYRGSTGYGAAWRDALEGRPGLTELEDIAAVRRWAVDSGLADPGRCVLAGGSWGGYLTLLGLGTSPAHWVAGVAAVPVADYVAAFEDEMEPLREFDRSLFGGSPDELPELYERCSPLTYVADVRAPVLVLAGANDPRCPIRQIENYLSAAAELGKDVEVYRFDAGHGSLVVDERVRQMRAELDFLARRLGLPPPA